jgi:hypothetical protein
MKIGYIISYFILLYLVQSCYNQPNLISDSIAKVWPDINTQNSILIIPGSGCEGCLDNATYFAINNLDSLRFSVVFTQAVSLKTLKFKIGENVYRHPKVKVDSFNIIPPMDTHYPIILYPKENKMVLVSPENPSSLTDLRAK